MRKSNVTREAYRRYAAHNPRYFPTKIAHTFLSALSPYFTLWMSGEIVTALSQGREAGTIWLLVGITLGGSLLLTMLSALLDRRVKTELEILKNNEAASFNQKTLSLDYDKLEDPDIRQLRRTVTENSYINGYGVYRMRLTVEHTWLAGIHIGLSLLLFSEMILSLSSSGFHPVSLLLFLGLLLCVVANVLFQRRMAAAGTRGSKEIGDFMLEENRLGRGSSTDGKDNRLYRQQAVLDRIHDHLNIAHLRLFTKVKMDIFRVSIPTQVTNQLTEVFAYLIVVFYCVLGIFPVGSVIKYVGYLTNLIGNFGVLFDMIGYFRENEQFLKVYLEYFDLPNDMYQGSLSVEKRSDRRFDIQFKDVSFRYPGSDTYAIKNLTLDLHSGEKLAVVGMNGSGKTTFIKLLCRLYDPTQGEIILNDFNVRKYNYREYLDLFSMVFQDHQLLALPLGNNVSSAREWDSQKAETILQQVGFGERLAELPLGLDTPLTKRFDEDGVNLSGGEAQKVALARALYRNAPFIILDEPTAALDPLAEAEIYARFDQFTGDKTAIYISHRLSSCRFCDRIAVFDQGRVVQIGTHEELLADTTGKYHELWTAQAQYYTK